MGSRKVGKNLKSVAVPMESVATAVDDFEILNYEEKVVEEEETIASSGRSDSVEVTKISIAASLNGKPQHNVKITETRSSSSRRRRPKVLTSSESSRDMTATFDIREGFAPAFLLGRQFRAAVSGCGLMCRELLQSPKFWLTVMGFGYFVFLLLFVGCMLFNHFYYR